MITACVKELTSFCPGIGGKGICGGLANKVCVCSGGRLVKDVSSEGGGGGGGGTEAVRFTPGLKKRLNQEGCCFTTVSILW